MPALALVPPPPSGPQSDTRPISEDLDVSDTVQIYDLLKGMDEKLDGLRGEIAAVDKSQAVIVAWKVQRETVHDPELDRRMHGFEADIRSLREDRSKVWGMATVLGAVAGWLAQRLLGH